MFTKLRNRFLMMNLITISLMMLVAFTAIYVITYRDVQRDIHIELMKVTDNYQRILGGSGKTGNWDTPDTSAPSDTLDPMDSSDPLDPVRPGNSKPDRQFDNGDRPPLMDRGGAPAERSVSFMLLTDKDWKILSTESPFEMDSDMVELALQEAVDQDRETGKFSLDGSRWIFNVRPTLDGNLVVFLEITSRQNILTNLVYTFAAVGLAMLIALYFASRYFANRSITPVKEAFDKQKQFIADASHELKTPLAIIHTNADVLLSNSEDTIRDQSKWLHYIKSETERMSKLTGDLLYLTEMDHTRSSVLYTPFDLSETVEQMILTMEAVLFEKELLLEYDIDPGIRVHGNSEQIKQVIMILLDNAIKYTNPGGTVALELSQPHGEAVLSVSNTGEGIAPEHLARIFDRFYRTDASRSRKQGGHGLGLAIAKSIIDQHRGKIYAKSTPGVSTTFYIHLV